MTALRDLEALNRICRKMLEVAEDRRSHLPAAVECLIASMIVTPKQLAAELAVTDQAATGMLRQVQAAGIAREATGRQSFRAFCLRV
jgi:hypothetical protein